MSENTSKEEKKINLYDCAALFAETMKERFPDGCDGSAILMMVTNGKKISYLMDGTDELITTMVAQMAIRDKEIMDIFSNGIKRAVDHLNKQDDDSIEQTT